MPTPSDSDQVQCLWDAKAGLGEGVLWHPNEHCVYWVDILASTLFRLTPDGQHKTWHFPGTLSAVAPCCDNAGLLATLHDGVYHLNLASNVVTPLIRLESELPDNRFNDGALDASGAFWFGSMDNKETSQTGCFYRLDTTGRVLRQALLGPFCITNGPAFSSDGNTMYFTDSINRRVYRSTVDSQGTPQSPELFTQFQQDDGYPDGMCTDTEGGVWISHFGAGRVSHFTADGEITDRLEIPAPNVTKCALGGEDFRTLYITTARKGMSASALECHPLAGGLFAARVDRCGSPSPLFDLSRARQARPNFVFD